MKVDDKAKLEEEASRFSLRQGELQGAGPALRVHPLMLRWLVREAVSIDTLTLVHQLASSPPLCCSASRALERRSHLSYQPAILQGPDWSQELPVHPDQQPLVVCTLAGSADERAGVQMRGQNMRLRRQAVRMWRRSKRQSAFYLQACPTTHIARRADIHPDELAPGSGGASPSRLVEPMGSTTMRRCFFTLPTLCRPHRPHRSMVPGTVPVWITHRYEYL